MRILIVEDAVRLAALLAEALAKHGFASDLAHGLGDADDAMAAARYDAIVLDLGLPDGDGLAWLKDKRSREMPPVLALTARGTLEERVAGLDAGVDDYMTKPFAAEEVAARLRALLRRPGAARRPRPADRRHPLRCRRQAGERRRGRARPAASGTGSSGAADAPCRRRGR